MVPATLDDCLARALLDAGPDALVLCDEHGRIVLANAMAEHLFGYAPGELAGEPVEVLVPEAYRGAHARERARFASDPRPRPMGTGRRLEGRRRDGSAFPVEISLSPVRTREGLFVAAAVRDIGDRLRIERALAAAESHVRTLVEQAPDGILMADLSGHFTDANEAACRMLGYVREELIGMTIPGLVAPDEHERLAAHRARLDEPGVFEVGEWRVLCRDGTYLPVEVSGKILEGGTWQGIMRDISARKRLEQEHEATLDRLRTVLEQCPVGIVLMGVRGDGSVEIELNERAKELFGRPIDEVRVSGLVSFISHVDGAPLAPEDAPMQRTLRGERVEPTELAITRPGGARLPIQARGAPLLDPSGAVVGGIVAFEDVSAEKDLERLRTEWNAIVAHDLRNPLNVIFLHARLLSRAAKGTGKIAESAAEIEHAAVRMSRMIQDLLDISRLEARKLSITRDPTRLDGLLEKAVGRANLTAPERPFELRVPREVPDVLVDADRIAQVLDNLLSNAIKYGAADTPVVVSLEVRGDALAVAVTNEGVGLAPESVNHLFQRFHRAPDGRLAGLKGIGLGLYIARELVEAHGGRITVDSTLDGSTTFRFTIPLA